MHNNIPDELQRMTQSSRDLLLSVIYTLLVIALFAFTMKIMSIWVEMQKELCGFKGQPFHR